MPARPNPLPEEERHLLAELGERVRLARLRRRLTAERLAQLAGITRVTLHRVEDGSPAVTMGTYLGVLHALGMSSDLSLLARDDQAGRRLQDESLPRRRQPARSRLPSTIRVDRYPQLQQLAWQLSADTELTQEEALQLYERNWRHIDRDAMTLEERELVKRLTATVGKGVMLV